MIDPIEELLAQMKAQNSGAVPPAEPSPPQSSPSPSIDRLAESTNRPAPARPAVPADSTDALLAELKAHYEAHDREEARQQQERQAIERRQQYELRFRQHSMLAQQAQTWLQQLQPHSGEAVWFEEFATNYPSRLEAAIDYLGSQVE